MATFDIYGNQIAPSGPSAGDPTVAFADLSPEQQAERRRWFNELAASHEAGARAVFSTPNNPDSFDTQIAKGLTSLVGRIVGTVGGPALGGAVNALSPLLFGQKVGTPFRGNVYIPDLPDVRGQGAAGIGGGILSAVGGALAAGTVSRRNPRTRKLIADGSAILGKLLGGNLLPALTVR